MVGGGSMASIGSMRPRPGRPAWACFLVLIDRRVLSSKFMARWGRSVGEKPHENSVSTEPPGDPRSSYHIHSSTYNQTDFWRLCLVTHWVVHKFDVPYFHNHRPRSKVELRRMQV